MLKSFYMLVICTCVFMLVICTCVGGDTGLLWEEVIHFSGFRLERPAKSCCLCVEADKVLLETLMDKVVLETLMLLETLANSLSRSQTGPVRLNWGWSLIVDMIVSYLLLKSFHHIRHYQ